VPAQVEALLGSAEAEAPAAAGHSAARSAGSAEDVGDALLEMQESIVTAEQLGAHLAVVERRLADLAAGARTYERDQARLSAESASSQRRLAAAESAAREQEGQWRSVGQGEHALFARVSELQLSGPPRGGYAPSRSQS
jgi:hypothetical protein